MKFILFAVVLVAAYAQSAVADEVEECATRVGALFYETEHQVVSPNVNRLVNLILHENKAYRGNYMSEESVENISVPTKRIQNELDAEKTRAECEKTVSESEKAIASIDQCKSATREQLVKPLSKMPGAMRVISAATICNKYLSL